MDRRRLILAASASALCGATPRGAWPATQPATWDNLVRVNSTQLKLVYLLPGADFRGYNKVLLDPPEAFVPKNWQRDYNRNVKGVSGLIDDSEVREALDEVAKAAGEIFAAELSAGGYPIVTRRGSDVLRLRVGVANIRVTAPETMTTGHSRTYASEAGSATLVLEARDSVTDAVLGRALDPRVTGDTSEMFARSSVSNQAEFRALIRRWAKASVAGLNELKRLSPIP